MTNTLRSIITKHRQDFDARGGLPVTYLAAITSEATQTLGRDAAAAVEGLL